MMCVVARPSTSSSSSPSSSAAAASSWSGLSSPFFNPRPVRTPPSPLLPWSCFISISCSYEVSSSLAHGGGGSSSSSSSTASPFTNTTVSVFWDLDNKPPKSNPYHAALYLRHAASQFGSVVDMVAYANRHAFIHVPQWVREERQDRKQLDYLERRGLITPAEPYVCKLCGRKCKTNVLLRKHFKQLHEREQNKRMARLNQLKGKKKLKFRQSIQPKSERYREAAKPVLFPKVGYGLESDLRRAGVHVRTVQYKPQAADIELKKQMENSMNKGVKCICLVSDDNDFSDMLRVARSQDLRTIVVGESSALRKLADFWFHWDDVSQGLPQSKIDEAVQRWRLKRNLKQDHYVRPEGSTFGGLDSELTDADVQHMTFTSNPVASRRFSAFSEEEQLIEEQESEFDRLSDDEEWYIEDEDDRYRFELDDDE